MGWGEDYMSIKTPFGSDGIDISTFLPFQSYEHDGAFSISSPGDWNSAYSVSGEGYVSQVYGNFVSNQPNQAFRIVLDGVIVLQYDLTTTTTQPSIHFAAPNSLYPQDDGSGSSELYWARTNSTVDGQGKIQLFAIASDVLFEMRTDIPIVFASRIIGKDLYFKESFAVELTTTVASAALTITVVGGAK